MAKVLRIQHIEDESGPFVSDHPEVRAVVDSTKLPAPHQDKGFNDEAVSRLRDHKASPTKFAFKDEKQMKHTFSDDHMDKLKEHGYEPKWVDAKDVWSSNHQVFYTTETGDKKHVDKQAEMKARTKFREISPKDIKTMNKSLDKIKDILQKAKVLGKIQLELEKGMKNSGLGGPGSVKRGLVKPSLPKLSKPGNNSATPSLGIKQPSKKNPIKSAEQTQNKDIKDIKMKEAKQQLVQPEMVKFEKNGQWSLGKIDEDVTEIGYDDSTDRVIDGATVNETQHRGVDVNIANKQPAQIRKKESKKK